MILYLLTIKIMLSKLAKSFDDTFIIFVIYQYATSVIDQLCRPSLRITKDWYTKE